MTEKRKARRKSPQHKQRISKAKREKLKAEEEKALEEAIKRAEQNADKRYAGDWLEDLFKMTGVKALVDALVEDCGCEDRKAAVNNFHESLATRYNKKRMWNVIYDAYEGMFGDKVTPKVRKSQCSSCHKSKLQKMRAFIAQKKMEYEFKK